MYYSILQRAPHLQERRRVQAVFRFRDSRQNDLVLHGSPQYLAFCVCGRFQGSTPTSVAVIAEISLTSAQKLLFFVIKKYVYRIKVSKNKLI